MNNFSKATGITLLITVVFTMAVIVGLHALFNAQKRELALNHERTIAELQREWTREKLQDEIRAHEEESARLQRRKDELRTALGGAVSAAAKDPEMSIAQMLTQLAQLCSPSGTRVRVRIERFTEFTTLVELPRRMNQTQLAELARCILEHSSDYMHRLQFSYQGDLLAELDRQAIESVENWRNISTGLVQQLLAQPDAARDQVNLASAGKEQAADDEEDPANVPEVELKEQAAMRKFRASLTAAYAQLDAISQLHDHAIRLADVRSIQDFEAKRKLLSRANVLMAECRPVLENPIAEFQRIMHADNIGKAYIASAGRTLSMEFGKSLSAVTVVFQRLAARAQAAEGVVDTMEKHFGEWEYASEGRIRFSTPAAAAAYDRAKNEMAQATDELETAFKQLSLILSTADKK